MCCVLQRLAMYYYTVKQTNTEIQERPQRSCLGISSRLEAHACLSSLVRVVLHERDAKQPGVVVDTSHKTGGATVVLSI